MKRYQETGSDYSAEYDDFEIIDLDEEYNRAKAEKQSRQNQKRKSPKQPQPKPAPEEPEQILDEDDHLYDAPAADKRAFPFHVNFHIVFLVLCVLIIGGIIFRLATWGEHIDLDEYFSHHEVQYQDDLLDQILPLTAPDGSIVKGKEHPTIVCFGNAPFADDRGDKDNLANLLAKATGSTVYNCAIKGSYLASLQPSFNPQEAPMDAFNFYWMMHRLCGTETDHYYDQAKEVLGKKLPKAADEVEELINTLDFTTVDVAVIMYDASDYLAGHAMYNDVNETDISHFTGNMQAGIELLKDNFPNIRIIVMSPTYAFALDENGEYVSSDIQTYGQDVLSTYVIRQCYSASVEGVTFVDNLYGTVTEENATEYLSDNLHLNKKGREKVLERLLYALNYYNK